MSLQHDRISRKLSAIGACWATRPDRYIDPNDPLGDQIKRRKTYHIHPDRSYPHQRHIMRFSSMREIEAWLKALEHAAAASSPEEAEEAMLDY